MFNTKTSATSREALCWDVYWAPPKTVPECNTITWANPYWLSRANAIHGLGMGCTRNRLNKRMFCCPVPAGRTTCQYVQWAAPATLAKCKTQKQLPDNNLCDSCQYCKNKMHTSSPDQKNRARWIKTIGTCSKFPDAKKTHRTLS